MRTKFLLPLLMLLLPISAFPQSATDSKPTKSLSVTGKLTRAMAIGAESTGWTIERDDQVAVLEHCRRHGIWILADDVYERLVYAEGMRSAPSFLTLAQDHDRLIVINSFSGAYTTGVVLPCEGGISAR